MRQNCTEHSTWGGTQAGSQPGCIGREDGEALVGSVGLREMQGEYKSWSGVMT